MHSAISEAPIHVVHEEVVNGWVELRRRMAVTSVEGSTSLLTAQTARVVQVEGVVIVAPVGVVVVPFQQRLCQRQGSQTLRPPKGQSPQFDG